MANQLKTLKIQQETHKGLRKYLAEKDLYTFDDGIKDLLNEVKK